MKVRLFGTDSCDKCAAMMNGFHKRRVVYIYINIDLDSTQELCDRYQIDEVPHVQILNDAGLVMYEHVGFIEVSQLLNIAANYDKKFNK